MITLTICAITYGVLVTALFGYYIFKVYKSNTNPQKTLTGLIMNTQMVFHKDGTTIGVVSTYADGIVDIAYRVGPKSGKTFRHDFPTLLGSYYDKVLNLKPHNPPTVKASPSSNIYKLNIGKPTDDKE